MDLAAVCFRDVAWLQHFTLSEASVLEYFSMSQFYDRTCNNEVLLMQARFTDNTALLSHLQCAASRRPSSRHAAP